MNRPLAFVWDNEKGAMIPRHPWLVRKEFEPGERVMLIEHEERSAASHSHAFARLHDIWDTLPESVSKQFPSEQHFRKRLLIDCGFYHQTELDAGTPELAQRVAAAMASIDDYAVVVVEGSMVIRRVAKSMSRASMNKEEFQRAKTQILELGESLIGASTGEDYGGNIPASME